MSNSREQILQTTCDLLEKQGYHGTGLNEIVKESGAPKGSLYYYFPEGKEQIAAEAVLQSGRMTAERVRAGLTENDSPSRADYEFVMKIAESVEISGFGSGGPLTAIAMETATQSERINSACREAYRMIEAAFLERLVNGGYDQAKAKDLATFMTAAIEGGIILSRTYHTGDPLRMVARQLKGLLSE